MLIVQDRVPFLRAIGQSESIFFSEEVDEAIGISEMALDDTEKCSR
jgi:hypothetical protein